MPKVIADTIIQQLGNICLSMLGAHMLVSLGDGLQFRIEGSEKTNLIQIILDPSDTYTLKFWKVSTSKKMLADGIPFGIMDWEMVSSVSDVYWDMLPDIIEQETGLSIGLSNNL